jgi:hypothetical protein
MNVPKLTLSLLRNHFAICRLSPDDDFPVWCENAEFYSITRSKEELSVVSLNETVPLDVEAERDWRGLRIHGPLDVTSIGILASLVRPLAEAEIPVLSISTYDTDYVFIRQEFLSQALAALKNNGHSIDF